jgi:hypothetical protein
MVISFVNTKQITLYIKQQRKFSYLGENYTKHKMYVIYCSFETNYHKMKSMKLRFKLYRNSYLTYKQLMNNLILILNKRNNNNF